MYPKTSAKPFKYLFDDFDSNTPLHHYWDGRFADSAYPSNITGGGYYLKKLRSPEWSNTAGQLVFPTYIWLNTPTVTRAKFLVAKVNSMLPPFTFQLAFRFGQIDNLSTSAFPQIDVTSFQILTAIQTNNLYQYILSIGGTGVSGQWVFNNNTFAANQDVYYKFVINADMTCTWDFKVNGTTPAPRPSSPGNWAPGTYKTATSSFNTQINSLFPDYFALRLGPRGGGKLDYLELKIHDHTL